MSYHYHWNRMFGREFDYQNRISDPYINLFPDNKTNETKWSAFLETPPTNAFESNYHVIDNSSLNLLEYSSTENNQPTLMEDPFPALSASNGTFVQIPDTFQTDTYNFEYNLKELPSRCLQLANIPSNATEEDLDYICTFFGDVQMKDYSKLSLGVAIIQFFSMESSQLMRLSLIYIRHKMISLIFSPEDYNLKENVSREHPENNGTIVLFHLPKNTSDELLNEIFGKYGKIRQIRHTPYKESQRFIEFYDTRSAAHALEAFNGKLLDKRNQRSKIAIEFSLPGGFKRNIQKFYRSALPTITRNNNYTHSSNTIGNNGNHTIVC